MNITRHTNPNGTYRYEIDGNVITKASKVIYTHATTYAVGDNKPTLFHKTASAAEKAKGHQGWTKTAVLTIQDGDAPAEAAPVVETVDEDAEPVAAHTVKTHVTVPGAPHRIISAETHHNRLSDAYAAFWNFVQNQSDDGRDSLRTDGELNRRIGGDTFTGYWTVELIQN